MGLKGAFETIAVELDGSAFRAVIYGAEGVRTQTVALDTSRESMLESLEAAVYSSESLTADYARTRLAVRTAAYTAVPEGLEDEASSLAHFADSEVHSVLTDPLSGNMRIVWGYPTDCLDFLRRTFRNAPLTHVLTPLTGYFGRCSSQRNSAKVFVHLNTGSDLWADIAAYDSTGRLLGLVSRPTPSVTDTLYYIAALMRRCGLDLADDEINICGDYLRRNALLGLLGRYSRKAMPMPYPAEAVASGADLTNSPLSLLV